jgi:fatty acid-binding protein DegV
MRLKPVIATKPDGRISLAGFLFGTRNRTDRFARFIARRAPKNQDIDVGIGHAVCEIDAKALEREIRARIPAIKKLVVSSLGPGLGVHGGPGTLLITISPTVSLDDIADGVD